MTDVTEWIKERRRIHNAAAEGPWWSTRDLQPATVFAGDGSADDLAVLTTFEHSDATAIVDAHDTLPSLLAAVEKVLELHKPVESLHGDYLCSTCAERDNCTVAMVWPCPTVRAVERAIND